MAYVLAALQAFAAIPKIGEQIERLTREMSRYFAEKRYRKDLEQLGSAADASTRALTEAQVDEALAKWHRIGH